MERWNAQTGRKSEDREKIRDGQDRRGRSQTREFEKVGKSRFTAFFPMICGSGAGQIRDEKLHTVVARSTNFQARKVCRGLNSV